MTSRPAWQPRTVAALHGGLAAQVARLADRARVVLDGVGSGELMDGILAELPIHGRMPLSVRGVDFLRPAGERFEYGREDVDAFRTGWLDAGALRREVFADPAGCLPALWDARRDRSARARPVPVPPRGVVLVAGLFLLGLDLPADLTVHLALSPAALLRRGVAAWQLPAFASYDAQVRPEEVSDLVVRAEDPLRPALLVRSARVTARAIRPGAAAGWRPAASTSPAGDRPRRNR